MVGNMAKDACRIQSDASRVCVTIDDIEVSVPRSATVLEAARIAGVDIPTLCYLELYNEIGACRICLVEVEGIDHLVAAQQSRVRRDESPHRYAARRSSRKMNLKLILSRHDRRCPTCSKRNMPSAGARRHHGYPRGFV
ncbi:MAG: 2Fe-2S iron-sulfur cluster-binding protein [Slackia sp.]